MIRPTDLLRPSPSSQFKTLEVSISDLLPEVSKFQYHTELRYKCSIFTSYLVKFKSNLLAKRVFSLNAVRVFAMVIQDLVSRVSTLTWWGSLRASVTPRAMPAVV